jgi:hypothetical protein
MYARVYCRVDTRIFQLVSDILSDGHPSFSVVSGILSVVGIPPVPIPIPEEIQLLMYARDRSIS